MLRLLAILVFALAVLISSRSIQAQGIEDSRTYGKMFVKPIAIGSFPPVCVTAPIAETSAKRGYVAMQNPDRPSLVVYVKEFSELDSQLYQSLETIAKFAEMPVFITVTLPKGVASEGKPEQFSPELYYTAEEMADLKKQLKKKSDKMQLASLDIGIAVNRFWRDSIGFDQSNDIIVGYVRSKIQTLHQLKSGSIDATQLDSLIKSIGKTHREPQNLNNPK